MEEALWYAKQRSQMEEVLWYMQQRSRSLQDYRKDNQRRWDDQAAYEINGRYLNPHEEDSQQMLQFLQEQQASLKQTDTKLESAYDHTVEINKLSEEIVKLLEFTQQDIARTYSDYHVYLDNHSAALSQLPVIQDLITLANSACN